MFCNWLNLQQSGSPNGYIFSSPCLPSFPGNGPFSHCRGVEGERVGMGVGGAAEQEGQSWSLNTVCMPTGGRAGTGYWKLGGRGSWKTRRRTVLKPEYLYMQNVIKWYRNAIQCMHAYQWPSWYEVLGVGGGGLLNQRQRLYSCVVMVSPVP